jgi:hypothetical protein
MLASPYHMAYLKMIPEEYFKRIKEVTIFNSQCVPPMSRNINDDRLLNLERIFSSSRLAIEFFLDKKIEPIDRQSKSVIKCYQYIGYGSYTWQQFGLFEALHNHCKYLKNTKSPFVYRNDPNLKYKRSKDLYKFNVCLKLYDTLMDYYAKNSDEEAIDILKTVTL